MNFIFSQRVIGYYPQWVMGSFPPNEIDFNKMKMEVYLMGCLDILVLKLFA